MLSRIQKYSSGFMYFSSLALAVSQLTSRQTIGVLLHPMIFRKLWSSSPQGLGITKSISMSSCCAMPLVNP